MEDLEVVTERLRSAEEAHGKEVDEQQRRSNDLQERLVETRAQKEQVWQPSEGSACYLLVAVPGAVVLCLFVVGGVLFMLT